jgi:hypothetical protein
MIVIFTKYGREVRKPPFNDILTLGPSQTRDGTWCLFDKDGMFYSAIPAEKYKNCHARIAIKKAYAEYALSNDKINYVYINK